MTIFRYLVLTTLCLVLIGCGGSEEAQDSATAVKSWPPGIHFASRYDDGILLSIVLLDEKKMQFYAGDRVLAEVWTRAPKPTDVFVAVRDGELFIGSGLLSTTDSVHVGEVELERSFTAMKVGGGDVVLGRLDGRIPFGLRLVPTTKQEKEAIRNGNKLIERD